jgi:hypothetical protein
VLSQGAAVERATSMAGVVRTSEGLPVTEDRDALLDNHEMRRLVDAADQVASHGA